MDVEKKPPPTAAELVVLFRKAMPAAGSLVSIKKEDLLTLLDAASVSSANKPTPAGSKTPRAT